MIAPNDINIKYSPYNWNVTATYAKTICAGAYLFMEFSGAITTLTATFDVTTMASPASKVGFRVDSGVWQDFTVVASISLVLPINNTWTKHTLEMVVISTTETANRWNSPQNTAVVFTGISADIAITTITVQNRKLYGIAIGDSITEGVRTLNMTVTNDTDRNDSRLAWAYPLKDILGAEIGVVGFGATGIIGSGSGNVPRFCDNIPYLYSGLARNFTTPQSPDFVIAHIGTNDGAGTDANVLTYSLSLINYLIANTPFSTKIFIMAGWRQTKSASIIQACNNCNDVSRVVYIDTTGWWSTTDASDGLHPYGYANISKLSHLVANAIRNNLSNVYIKSSTGVATPLFSSF